MEGATVRSLTLLVVLVALVGCREPGPKQEIPGSASAKPSQANGEQQPVAYAEESTSWIAFSSHFPKKIGPYADAGESQITITDKATGIRFLLLFSPWTAKQLELAERELGEEVTLGDRPTRPYLQAVGVWDEGRWHFASIKGYATVPMMQLQVNPASALSHEGDAERPNDIWIQVVNGHVKLFLAYGENLEFGVFHLDWDRESRSIDLLQDPTLSEDFNAEFESFRGYAGSGRILHDGLSVETS